MGIFNKLFGGRNEATKNDQGINWQALQSKEEVDKLLSFSAAKTQIVFKHSTTCGISRMVLNIFESNFSIETKQADFHFLDLHANRKVSDYISERTDVAHQSPQLLIVKNGEVVFHTSHGAITDVELQQFV